MIAPNPPGQSELAYRVGTHATFKRAMLAALSSGRWPALEALVTRDDDDFTIALLDSWAVVSDVLTFYSERIANESYLQTSTELASVSDLLALVGYALQPGVAAQTLLAYSVQAAGAVAPTDIVTFAAGAQVKSLPGPGELPQTFETSDSLDAIPNYNALAPLLRKPQAAPATDMANLALAGPAARLQKGDVLVVVPAASPALYAEVAKVDFDATTGLTTVGVTNVRAASNAPKSSAVIEPKRRTVSVADVLSRSAALPGTSQDAIRTVLAESFPQAATRTTQVFALRTSAHLYGYNAPSFLMMPETIRSVFDKDGESADWPFSYPTKGPKADRLVASMEGATPVPDPAPQSQPEPAGLKARLRALLAFASGNATAANALDPATGRPLDVADPASEARASSPTPLDRTYPVLPGDWVAIKWPGEKAPLFFSTVATATNGSFNAFGLAGPSTLLSFTGGGHSFPASTEDVRGALVYLQSEVLTFAADIPLATEDLQRTIDPSALDIDGTHPLLPGHRVVISGTTLDRSSGATRKVAAAGTIAASVFTDALATPNSRLSITLDTAPKSSAAGDSLPTLGSATIYANVVSATHGESVDEVLGSGDATASSQTFALSHSPLTYLPSAVAPSGIASTLVIEINGIAWNEIPSLTTASPRDHVYVTRSGPDGSTTIRFGDGVRGARLPTGSENVHAYYRFGTGGDGTLAADQVTLAITRPLSLRAVTNPIATSGGVDPEGLVSAQRNGPAHARIGSRLVTLRDFADAARATGGVSDAQAEMLGGASFPSIVVTISDDDGTRTNDGARAGVEALLRANSNTPYPIRVVWFRPTVVRISVTIAVEPPFRRQGTAQTQLRADIIAAVTTAFSLQQRTIGAPLYRSELIAVIGSVAGTIAVTSILSKVPSDANDPPTEDMPERIAAERVVMQGRKDPLGAGVVTVDATTFAIAGFV